MHRSVFIVYLLEFAAFLLELCQEGALVGDPKLQLHPHIGLQHLRVDVLEFVGENPNLLLLSHQMIFEAA